MIVRSMPRLLLGLLAGAAPPALSMAARAQDLSAHCASVGNDDRVSPIPAALVPAAASGAGRRAGRTGRDVSGGHGFSLHGRKGLALQSRREPDLRQRRRPSRHPGERSAWCREHPGSDVVPMAATGHATIYSWACAGSEPRITQAEKLDPRGFIAASGRRWGNRLDIRLAAVALRFAAPAGRGYDSLNHHRGDRAWAL